MKQGWVLSGGGGRGAFQAGAIFYLATVEKEFPHYVAGISVGALNGLAVACRQIGMLYQLWHSIETKDIYRNRLRSRVIRLLSSQINLISPPQSIHSTTPLWNLLKEYTEGWVIQRYFRIGVVNIDTGQYYEKEFAPGIQVDDNVLKWVMASAAIPGFFPPMRIQSTDWVDGGVKHQTPMRALLETRPDKVTIITNNNWTEKSDLIDRKKKNKDFVQIGASTLQILLASAFNADLDQYFERNYVASIMPGNQYKYNKKIIRYYPTLFIEPTNDLGDSLDFSSETNEDRFMHGYEQAKKASEKFA